jgi:hypothetical protein
MVSIEITVDTRPEAPDLHGQTTYRVTRETEEEAAISTLSIMIAVYGNSLKHATKELSEFLEQYAQAWRDGQ